MFNEGQAGAGTAPAKVRYDGSACLNVRSVVSVCELLSQDRCAQPLTWEELSAVLWFVETCVTSKNIFFDGTIPQQTATRAVESVEILKKGRDLRDFNVSAITAKGPKEILDSARNAMAETRLLLDHFAFRPDIDKPLDQKEHENFLAKLDLAISSSPSGRESLALEWISDGFRGGKCIAALIANGDELMLVARRLYDQHPDQKALVSAALINRFRLSYVNHLAESNLSAYVPEPGFESLTEDHVWLFKDYLLKQVESQVKVAPDDANLIVENMNSKSPLPCIGLYALMATKAVKRPAAILETAYNSFRQDSSLMKLIWENTKGGIALKKGNAEEYVPAIEQHFSDCYKELAMQADGLKKISRSYFTTAHLVPAILKVAVSFVPAGGALGALCEVAFKILTGAATELGIPWLAERLKGEDCDSSINQYRSLKWRFQEDPDMRASISSVTDQVARVFGRPLTMAA
jgi:hypothetical protein